MLHNLGGADIEPDAAESGHAVCFDCWLWNSIMMERDERVDE
jgi:hypothetical protein